VSVQTVTVEGLRDPVAVGRTKLHLSMHDDRSPGPNGDHWMHAADSCLFNIMSSNENHISPGFGLDGSVSAANVSISDMTCWAHLGNEPQELYSGEVLMICENANLATLEGAIGRAFSDM
jgi:hypothetical protein